MLKLVTTGGQTGADQAGWRAAKALGIATGGWMPMGFRTEGPLDGDGIPGPDELHPEFAELYGAQAHESLEYRVRTRANVREADAVVWFGNPSSRGGRTTLGLAEIVGIPTFVIELGEDGRPTRSPAQCAEAIRERTHEILLVSGNRESKAPGIGVWIEAYLIELFRLIPHEEEG